MRFTHMGVATGHKIGPIRPIYFMRDERVTPEEVQAIMDGVVQLLTLAEIRLEVINFGVWRHPGGWRDGETLSEFRSVDWYIHQGRKTSRDPGRQLNSEVIVLNFCVEPWQETNLHYDVCLVSQDLYSGDTNFVAGTTLKGWGTVLSTFRFQSLAARQKADCLKTLALHEVGHVFGLLPEDRQVAISESLGRHCTNRCVMRQGLRVPHDWLGFAQDASQYGPFCKMCLEALRAYFRQ